MTKAEILHKLNDLYIFCDGDYRKAILEAIPLLRSNEPPIQPEKLLTVGMIKDTRVECFLCGNCSNVVKRKWIYCPRCGREIAWDADRRIKRKSHSRT